MTPWLDDGDVRLLHGDCMEVMRTLEAESVDAVVTDPPYGLGFMGHEWDQPGEFGPVSANGTPGGINEPRQRRQRQPSPATGAGHARDRDRAQLEHEADHTKTRARGGAMHAGRYDLSHSANARYQAWCEAWAIEALRVLKPGGHLVSFGGSRTFHRLAAGVEDAGFEIRDALVWLYGSGFPKSLDVSKAIDKAAGAERAVVGANPNGRSAQITAPATPDAERWQGWGTALKPGHEPITLARKPLTGTVAANVLAYGTGALHIDACRIDTGEPVWSYPQGAGGHAFKFSDKPNGDGPKEGPATGRWPANVVLDAEAAELLDAQTGERRGWASQNRSEQAGAGVFGVTMSAGAQQGYDDNGGASRFFYTAKASASERSDGLPTARGNSHPTVKPVDLMAWLIRLLVPPGALILDPFGGSGTTGVAARRENVRCILIEREAEYLPIIAGQLSQQSLFG